MSDDYQAADKLSVPDVIEKPRSHHMGIARRVRSPHEVLSDAYETIGNEIHRLRLLSCTDGLSNREAETLQRLVRTMGELRAQEREAAQQIVIGGKASNLAELDDATVANLFLEASKCIAAKKEP